MINGKENYCMDENSPPASDESNKPPSSWMIWKQRRYVVAILAFFGFFNVYSLRVNLSIAIVAMTENKTIKHTDGNITYGQEFDWDSKQQGFILSSFFYGYITTQLLGGWLASRLGGKRVFGLGIAMTAALTLITPYAAKTNFYFLLAVRIIEGVFEGVTYPCIHAVWAKWAPPLERSRLATAAFSGSYVGTVISMPVCAYLSKILGWESIFYVFGTIGLIWYITWSCIVSDSPSQDPHISREELKYIKDSLGNQDHKGSVKHPWKSMLLSAPVWAIVVAHFSENWGFYTLLTQLPKFMKDILHFELGKTGIMSAVPYLAMSIVLQIAGYLADWLQLKGILNTTQVRKIFNCGAFISQTIFMLAAAYLLSPTGSTICLTLAVGLGGFAWAGFGVNYLDIAPQHASVIMGIGNTFGTLPGIISPIITGYIVTTPVINFGFWWFCKLHNIEFHYLVTQMFANFLSTAWLKNESEWQIVFYIASSVYLLGCIVYGIFASGDVQTWATETQTLKSNDQSKTNAHDNFSFVTD